MLAYQETGRSINQPEVKQADPRLYFDVREFKEEDLTLILAENRLAELNKRISPYPLIYDALGNPLMITEKGELAGLPLDDSDDLGRREIEGMSRIKRLTDLGYKAVVWLSPAGGETQYNENRIVAARNVDNFENARWLSTYWGTDNKLKEKIVAELNRLRGEGGMVLESRGICSQHEREVFLEKAREILKDITRENGTLGEVVEAEDLRSNPIGIDLKDGETWYGYLSSFFTDVEDVWQAIAEGEDLRNKLDLALISAEIKGLFGSRMAGVSTFEDAVRLGAEIERYIAANHGINLKAGGAHGRSNSSMEGRGGRPKAFSTTFSESKIVTKDTPGAKKCNKCGLYYVGQECPFCQ